MDAPAYVRGITTAIADLKVVKLLIIYVYYYIVESLAQNRGEKEYLKLTREY
jgi:hypothetical protein